MHTTLTAKGQITIPAAMRREMRLKPGDELTVFVTKRVKPTRKKVDVKRKWLGRLKNAMGGMTSKQWIDECRGPSEWSW